MSEKESKSPCENCQVLIADSKLDLHEAYCLRFNVKCQQCPEFIHKDEMEEHIEECHSLQPCEYCKTKFSQEDLKKHQDEECNSRPMICPYCEVSQTYIYFKSHLDYCGSKTKVCQKCNKNILSKEIIKHEETCNGIIEEKPQISEKNQIIQNLQKPEKKTEVPLKYNKYENKPDEKYKNANYLPQKIQQEKKEDFISKYQQQKSEMDKKLKEQEIEKIKYREKEVLKLQEKKKELDLLREKDRLKQQQLQKQLDEKKQAVYKQGIPQKSNYQNENKYSDFQQKFQNIDIQPISQMKKEKVDLQYKYTNLSSQNPQISKKYVPQQQALEKKDLNQQQNYNKYNVITQNSKNIIGKTDKNPSQRQLSKDYSKVNYQKQPSTTSNYNYNGKNEIDMAMRGEKIDQQYQASSYAQKKIYELPGSKNINTQDYDYQKTVKPNKKYENILKPPSAKPSQAQKQYIQPSQQILNRDQQDIKYKRESSQNKYQYQNPSIKTGDQKYKHLSSNQSQRQSSIPRQQQQLQQQYLQQQQKQQQQIEQPRNRRENSSNNNQNLNSGIAGTDDEALQRVIQESIEMENRKRIQQQQLLNNNNNYRGKTQEELDLEKAIQLSLMQ
ncbi:hypothetical protein PPERSA_10531 [Pseudocohnilembus persalinus]|uniref:TRAFD1/XAF1 zinc finger domain-containing protein n=1 Tax=Pseudocohnilembus persalinus TaxID=266149 RepID=A0A0V0R7U5_PSEPJ|nr:hypothetical protein PPERSA_10531 [Pseudocohnilembus persalinus]|eukprot:KRX10432.1 hypothetical protein PPERSA_10531 [Pseudocohnilembus persalinus]